MNSLVSILIVNWNASENLKECLTSLYKIDYPNYEVILVDNGSTDDSIEMASNHFPKAKVIRSNTNLGFAGGNNLGLKHCKGEYILFLNNDTLVTRGFLSELVSFIERDDKLGVVQPTILFHRPGTPLHRKINSVGSFLLNSGFLYHLNYGKKFVKEEYDDSYDIYTAYGACFLVRKEIIDKAGGLFDADYFAYFEETDFSHRVWLAKYRIKIYTPAIIYHKGAKTAETLPSSFIQYHSFKNRLYTYLKDFGFSNLFKIFIPHLLVCEVSTLLYLLVRRPDYSLAIQKAIFWNLFHLEKLIRDRKNVQKNIRKVRDSDFIPKLTKSVSLRYYYFLSSGQLENYNK